MNHLVTLLSGAAVGAGVMYIMDPAGGKRRRAYIRDAAVHMEKTLTRTADIASRDASNRLKGIFEETRKLTARGAVDDEVLRDRVSTATGRVSSHPNVEVIVKNGHVTLLGPVVDTEERDVIRAAQAVSGVKSVRSRLRPYKRLNNQETQQGQKGAWFDFMRAHWSPATRFTIGAIGAMAVIAGAATGGRRGIALMAAGGSLAARAATNADLTTLIGIGGDSLRAA